MGDVSAGTQPSISVPGSRALCGLSLGQGSRALFFPVARESQHPTPRITETAEDTRFAEG